MRNKKYFQISIRALKLNNVQYDTIKDEIDLNRRYLPHILFEEGIRYRCPQINKCERDLLLTKYAKLIAKDLKDDFLQFIYEKYRGDYHYVKKQSDKTPIENWIYAISEKKLLRLFTHLGVNTFKIENEFIEYLYG